MMKTYQLSRSNSGLKVVFGLVFFGTMATQALTSKSFPLEPSYVQNQTIIADNNLTALDYFARGIKKYESQQYQEAIADFSQAITINPSLIEALFFRGVAYETLQKHELAIADFSAAIKINSEYAMAYLGRALSYVNINNILQAKSDFRQAAYLFDQQDNREGHQIAMEALELLN